MLKKGFTLIELMVVVAVIGVLAATLVPQLTNIVYKARVSATASSLQNFKMALDMLVADLGVKPSTYGAIDMNNDQLGLLKRSSAPSQYQSMWNGPYIKAYPVSGTAPLLAYSDTFWYYYSWPGTDSGTWGDWCGTAYGVLLHSAFINYAAKQDVEKIIIGRVDPDGDNWLYWCGFYDSRQTSPW